MDHFFVLAQETAERIHAQSWPIYAAICMNGYLLGEAMVVVCMHTVYVCIYICSCLAERWMVDLHMLSCVYAQIKSSLATRFGEIP